MSIQAMKKRFVGRFGKWILYGLAFIFLVTLPFMFSGSGGGPLVGGNQPGEGEGRGASDPVAKINGQTLTRAQFDRSYQQNLGQVQAIYAQVGGAIGVERLWTFRLEAMDQAINDALIRAEAKAKGVRVEKREIGKKIEDNVKQTVEMLKLQSKGQDPERIYAQIVSGKDGVRREKMSERKFRRWVNDVLWAEDRGRLEMEILTEKVKAAVAPQPPISEQELLASYESITPREILISLHPRGKPERSEEQARERAEELLAKVRGGADFAALARQESDDEDAKMTGGVRDSMMVRNMDPEWTKAVAPLKVGEVSQPIKTPYAYLIVKVEKRERQVPPDFEKNKQDELRSLASQRQNRVWEQYMKDLRARAKIEILDPEMKGYATLREGKVEEGLALLKQAVENPEKLGPAGAASANFQLATYLASRNQWQEAVEAYTAADDYLQRQSAVLPGARVQTLMGMGRSYENLNRIYKEQGKAKEAQTALEESLSWYQVASEQTNIPSYHEQLQAIYRGLGQTELVKQEQQWLDDYRKAEAEKAKAYEEQQRMMEKEAGRSQRPIGPAPTPAPPPSPAPLPSPP